MAKLLNILAASIGGGLAFGVGMNVGIRFLAADPAAEPGGPVIALADAVARRLEELEERLIAIDTHSGDYVDAVIAGQSAELVLMQERLRQRAEPKPPNADDLRLEMQGWVNSTLNVRLAEVEARLRNENEQKQQAVLDVFIENLQTRVVQRITKLEDDVTAQGVALTGLHDYSLQTERNMQKLLSGVERLIAGQPGPAKAVTVPVPDEVASALSVPNEPPTPPSAPAELIPSRVTPVEAIQTSPSAAVPDTLAMLQPGPPRGLFSRWFH